MPTIKWTITVYYFLFSAKHQKSVVFSAFAETNVNAYSYGHALQNMIYVKVIKVVFSCAVTFDLNLLFFVLVLFNSANVHQQCSSKLRVIVTMVTKVIKNPPFTEHMIQKMLLFLYVYIKSDDS